MPDSLAALEADRSKLLHEFLGLIDLRPGANTRQGEVAAIFAPLEQFFSTLCQINAPGTLQGGEVCKAERHFFIAFRSARTKKAADIPPIPDSTAA